MSALDKKEKVRRNYKDTVFTDLFTNWESPVSLYNSLFSCNEPKETKVEHLQISNALYTSMKCDLSFKIKDELVVIVEHQSTINRNMPIRFLMYIGKIYENLLDTSLRYARTLKCIPTPRFAVLYNGNDPFPERDEMKLSDAYLVNVLPQLDLTVAVININYGKNKEMMAMCPTLNGYSYLDSRIKAYKDLGDDRFEMAIKDCIQNNMIVEYLQQQQKRVKNMLQDEYDYEKDIATQRAEAHESGILEGIEKGIEKGIERGSYDTKIETVKNCLNLKLPVETIMQITGIEKETIEKVLLTCQ